MQEFTQSGWVLPFFKEFGFLKLVFVWSFSPLSVTYGYVEHYPASSNLFHCLKCVEPSSTFVYFSSWSREWCLFFRKLIFSTLFWLWCEAVWRITAGFQVWIQRSTIISGVAIQFLTPISKIPYILFWVLRDQMGKNGDSIRKFLGLSFDLLYFYC